MRPTAPSAARSEPDPAPMTSAAADPAAEAPPATDAAASVVGVVARGAGAMPVATDPPVRVAAADAAAREAGTVPEVRAPPTDAGAPGVVTRRTRAGPADAPGPRDAVVSDATPRVIRLGPLSARVPTPHGSSGARRPAATARVARIRRRASRPSGWGAPTRRPSGPGVPASLVAVLAGLRTSRPSSGARGDVRPDPCSFPGRDPLGRAGGADAERRIRASVAVIIRPAARTSSCTRTLIVWPRRRARTPPGARGGSPSAGIRCTARGRPRGSETSSAPPPTRATRDHQRGGATSAPAPGRATDGPDAGPMSARRTPTGRPVPSAKRADADASDPIGAGRSRPGGGPGRRQRRPIARPNRVRVSSSGSGPVVGVVTTSWPGIRGARPRGSRRAARWRRRTAAARSRRRGRRRRAPMPAAGAPGCR